MKTTDLVIGKHYTVQLGRWRDVCRLEQIVGPDRATVLIDDWVRSVPASSIIEETISPEEHTTIIAKMREDARLSIEKMLEHVQVLTPEAPFYIPKYTEPMIVKQGSHIRLGDYGT